MLFNSIEFLFAFLPLTLLLTAAMLRWRGPLAGIVTLTLASLFFYGYWEARALLVIASSICFNFLLAQTIARSKDRSARRRYLVAGVCGNLAGLAYFKYANFFIENIDALFGLGLPALGVVLPLAISFYTFQQIAFLVDTFRGEMDIIPLRYYLISVVFFPHLIAGPLLHYRDIIKQIETRFVVNWSTVSAGFPIFIIGLAKKVVVADPIAQFVTPLFLKAQTGPLEFFEAWAAALGYTAQLYFDFSGYSDMAIGLGLMFGIALPLNFYSPYKAVSIIDFWRRWHMTLSAFLRDYLYIPLGGNRAGPRRRYVNLMIVMLLGGLWHGAAWTFVFWGLLHGSYLVVNTLWNQGMKNFSPKITGMLTPMYGVLTFVAVVIGWVFFRSSGFQTALNVLAGMFYPSVVSLPGEIGYYLNAQVIHGITWGQGMNFPDFVALWSYVIVAYAIIWSMPNTAQIFNLNGRSFDFDQAPAVRSAFMRTASLAAVAWATFFGIFSSVPSEFLYFQF